MLIRNLLYTILILVLAGCAGTESFNRFARAGDTVAVAVGWRQNLSKENITVEITPAPNGIPVVLGPNDPAIRAVINFYPDPLSSLLVSPRIGTDLTSSAQLYASLVEANYTGSDKDWSQTVVFLNLPADLPVGRVNIQISGGGHTNPPSSILQVIEGAGSPSNFSTEGGGLNADQLAALTRVQNATVRLSGATVPHAVQIEFRHDADRDTGGAGKAYVVNPRGDIKSSLWWDDGSNLRVILAPNDGRTPSDLADFKFYIAGGVTGLYVMDTKAFDDNGNPMTGVTATLDAGP